MGIDPLLKELLPEQVVDYYDLELTLDGHSLLGSAYTTEDLNVGFRIDNIDTLVVPEPETYAWRTGAENDIIHTTRLTLKNAFDERWFTVTGREGTPLEIRGSYSVSF